MKTEYSTPKVTALTLGDDGEAVFVNENQLLAESNVTPLKPRDAGWFVAVVRVNCEKRIAKSIQTLLNDKNIWFEYWIPTTKVVVEDKRTKKRKRVEKLFLSTFIFCHIGRCHLNEIRFRSDVYKMLTMPGCRDIYCIPDHEIENYQRFVENPDEPVAPQTGTISQGQKVRVIAGSMKGIEAYVQRVKGKKAIIGCEIKYISSATIEIDRTWLEVIDNK